MSACVNVWLPVSVTALAAPGARLAIGLPVSDPIFGSVTVTLLRVTLPVLVTLNV